MKKTIAVILLGSVLALPHPSQAEASANHSTQSKIQWETGSNDNVLPLLSIKFEYGQKKLSVTSKELYRWIFKHYPSHTKPPVSNPNTGGKPDVTPKPEKPTSKPDSKPNKPSEKPQPKPEKPTEKPQPKPEKPSEKPQPEELPVTKPVPGKPSTPEAGQKPEQSVDTPQTSISQIEQAVLTLTNKERQKANLSPLKADDKLMKSARQKSADMATNNYFSHTSPTYGSPFDQMKANGITYRAAAENIAMGQRSAEEVVQGWMNSPGHRQNILTPNFTHIGIGYDAKGHYWTQQFIQK